MSAAPPDREAPPKTASVRVALVCVEWRPDREVYEPKFLDEDGRWGEQLVVYADRSLRVANADEELDA